MLFLAQFSRLKTVPVAVQRTVVFSIIHDLHGRSLALAHAGWNGLTDGSRCTYSPFLCNWPETPVQAELKGCWKEGACRAKCLNWVIGSLTLLRHS